MRLDRANPAQYHEACWTRMKERRDVERLMKRVQQEDEQVEYDENGLPIGDGCDELDRLLEQQEKAAEQFRDGLITEKQFTDSSCTLNDLIRIKTLPSYWNTCVPEDA
jgi:hypothetical protein